MFIDHLTCCMLEVARGADGRRMMYLLPHGELLDSIGRGIGRTAFPIYCFLLVEGFYHTRDRRKYLLRLLLLAVFSQPVFEAALFNHPAHRHLDTLFTLSIGLAAVWIIDMLRQVRREAGGAKAPLLLRCALCLAGCAAAGGACLLAKVLWTDYRWGGVLTILLFYLLYAVREYALTGGWIVLSVYHESEMLSFPAFVLMYLYNGERGRQNKYFFYLFYPAHLLLLVLLRRAVFGM
jgi:hypothetical protein